MKYFSRTRTYFQKIPNQNGLKIKIQDTAMEISIEKIRTVLSS